jgi:Lectin C-type domain
MLRVCLAAILLPTLACSVALEGTGGDAGHAGGAGAQTGAGGTENSGGSSAETGGAPGTGGDTRGGGGAAESGGGGGNDVDADSTGTGGVDEAGGAAGNGGVDPFDDAGARGGGAEAGAAGSADGGGEPDSGLGEDASIDPAVCAKFPGAKGIRPPGAKGIHCYWVHNTPATFPSAQSTCSNEGGHLANVLSAEEDAFLTNLVMNWNEDEVVWIGLSDGKGLLDQGTYVWITGATSSYSEWGTNPTQPDLHCDPCGTGKMCCEHRGALLQDGTFWDRREDAKYRYVCEGIP